MLKYFLIILAIITSACSAPIQTYLDPHDGQVRISSDFTSAEVERIVAGITQWQRATRGAVELRVSISDPKHATIVKKYAPGVAGDFYYYEYMEIIPDLPPDRLETVVMHELGHAFRLNHQAYGLMYPYVTDPDQMCIDQLTVDLFCQLNGCPNGSEPTCSPDAILGGTSP